MNTVTMAIYMHTCIPTGESYIGLTTKSVEERLNEHIKVANNGGGFSFHEAIRKYGIENFETTVLESNLPDKETLAEREIYWINHFDTYRNGLNMTRGGESGEWTEESHAKSVLTRKEVQEDGLTSYQKGGRKTLKTKQETFLEDGRSLLQATADKTAEVRRDRGDFDKMAEEMKGIGVAPEKFICEHCGKETNSGNYHRWHGDNCKMNPNITQEQLTNRTPWNKGITAPKEVGERFSEISKGMVVAYDIINNKRVKLTKEEFDANKNIQYVGHTSKLAIKMMKEINDNK